MEAATVGAKAAEGLVKMELQGARDRASVDKFNREVGQVAAELEFLKTDLAAKEQGKLRAAELRLKHMELQDRVLELDTARKALLHATERANANRQLLQDPAAGEGSERLEREDELRHAERERAALQLQVNDFQQQLNTVQSKERDLREQAASLRARRLEEFRKRTDAEETA